MALLIKNAFIIDGTGRDFFRGDILAKKNKILAVGDIPNYQAEEIIDASSCFASPGFIDPDSSSDFSNSIFFDRFQKNYLKQGVSSIILGHGGVSLAPIFGFPEHLVGNQIGKKLNFNWRSFYDFSFSLSKIKFGVNIASLFGEINIRDSITDTFEERDLTENEMKVFKKILENSLKEGALGISFGFGFSYSLTTPPVEIAAAAKSAFQKNAVVSVRVKEDRFETKKKFLNLLLQEKRKMRSGMLFLSQAEVEDFKWLKRSNSLKEISASFHPSGFSLVPLVSLISSLIKRESVEKLSFSLSPSEVQEEIKKKISEEKWLEKAVIIIAKDKSLEGKTLKDISRSRKEPLALCLINLAERCNFNITFSHSSNLIDGDFSFFKEKGMLVSSFGNFKESSSSFPYFLKTATSSKENWLIEKAVEKITKIPADLFGFKDRGVIKEGKIADISLFDKNFEIKSVIVGGKKSYSEGIFYDSLGGSFYGNHS
ncbi:MAG: hypothetical protein A2390_02345 [Candidatus Liptonbacteria bacterium RIFOXYB1_FULL_36_10]|uniref:Amidohydrolase-related domain-containing protein n=2 Tax=Candidatus Liptoniibacteriota TaxID=1817909 RepID=A0A1G2CLY0_9BACT|nr:MAG: hypothetical protein A2390_02345 [Candidatus Liptonbacteria bacterium RIFOXYB1_FULL_36_10]OGZ04163.1 MAG: hypothetical protein A2604_02210 [Candidatus Liptonbacteria bacterium RIFOXYD1_FULL_36_11]